MAVLSQQLKSYKPKKQPAKSHLGFANGHEEQLFRALAAVHPKGVAITEVGWRLYADEHVKLGTFRCVVNGQPVCQLTRRGEERAVVERLMREPT